MKNVGLYVGDELFSQLFRICRSVSLLYPKILGQRLSSEGSHTNACGMHEIVVFVCSSTTFSPGMPRAMSQFVERKGGF